MSLNKTYVGFPFKINFRGGGHIISKKSFFTYLSGDQNQNCVFLIRLWGCPYMTLWSKGVWGQEFYDSTTKVLVIKSMTMGVVGSDIVRNCLTSFMDVTLIVFTSQNAIGSTIICFMLEASKKNNLCDFHTTSI